MFLDAPVPTERKPIRVENTPFFKVLNAGDFERARIRLKADPGLAHAENDEHQRALFDAARTGGQRR